MTSNKISIKIALEDLIFGPFDRWVEWKLSMGWS
jgi:hypothetical protein